MIELLAEAAGASPDHLAVISPTGETTYAELLRQAEAAAAFLCSSGHARIGVLEPDPAVVLAILAGASLAGVEACVYPLNANASAVDDLFAQFDHELLVTARTGHHAASVSPDDVLSNPPGQAPRQPPASRPLLVMTTGTSGHPRGVRHDWSRLLRAVNRIVPAPHQRWLLAYGLNQFGGLQILIHVLASRATLVAGETFQPKDGLAAARAHDVTHVSGTPTFWRFLLNQIRSDGGPAPRLAQVTLGGEAVPSALLADIRETFPDAKVSQIYGATEFGQNITVRDGLPGLPVSMLQSGGDVEFKIVDGELHVRSRASMLGYHGEQPVEPDTWRATGDLVELVGDRVEFRGRRTDVINVGGIKVHPLPVEERASQVAGVAAVRAFGRPNSVMGSVVAAEVVLAPGYDAEEVETAVREACEDLPPAARPASIRVVETIAVTGNKMTRGNH